MMKQQEISNLDWYTKKSEDRGLTVRCPFATVEKCPRYYASLSLLGEVGCTKIEPTEDKRLLAFWEKSDLWPRTLEQGTSVSNNGKSIGNFCPEITLDQFGHSVTSFYKYIDNIDSEFAHKQLEKIEAPSNDERWFYEYHKSQHYSECPIYAVLMHN